MIKPPLSRSRRAGEWLFISGQLARGDDGAIVAGGIEPQARRTLDNLRAATESAGATLAEIVKVTVWLTDPADAAAFNRVYRDYFSEPYPARSMVVSALIADGALLEVEAIAWLG